ncbi:hypothetical protein DFR58_12933 [Anaerobacterium chartisolvens]|uniref:CopG family transcriptional regulator n=1 Tax=Anaerobacterium chartisolvens TaxID=1297424 RepID=A0A369AMN6_9FIRM|nr:hypothetical protein [Anaerobacterium chartisolvens]RCX10441.1 hypothetical protein DFR58_12933 [Anaerobacterium chartisolvens]
MTDKYIFRVDPDIGQKKPEDSRDKKVKAIKVYCTREDHEKFQRYCADQRISCSVYLGKVIRRLTRKME